MTSLLTRGVTVVVTGARTPEGLHRGVRDLLAALDAAGRPAHVVLVDDAHRDPRSAEAEWLAWAYPERVEVVRHAFPEGTDATERDGVAAALAHAEHPMVLVADAEDLPAGLPALLDAADAARAEVLSGPGYRLYARRLLDDLPSAGEFRSVVAQRARREGTRVIGRLDRSRRRRSPRHPRDRVLTLVTLGAAVVSVAAMIRALVTGVVLTYPDAVAHLVIARRVFESPTPGATQLGAVWLPAPHVVAALPAVVDPLYESGLAGAVVSMAAYVLLVRWVYLLVHELTGQRGAAVAAALVVGMSPNVLYLQSTPMTELPLLAGLAGGSYYLARWCRTGRDLDLVPAAVLVLVSTLVRYEAWVFAVTAAGIVVLTAWRREAGERVGIRARRTEAQVLFFGVVAFLGVVSWIVWNAVIFSDATFFYDGQYAEVGLLPEDIADGSWSLTLRTYWYAVTDNLGVPLTIAGVLGLVLLVARLRTRGVALAALAPAVLLPFFLWFLYSGSRPLRVVELTGMRYNVRFGLVMIIPVALGVGWLVAVVARRVAPRVVALVAACLVLAASGAVASGGIATLQEAQAFRALPQDLANDRAAAWWRGAYTSGPVLMDTPGNETVLGDAHLPTRQVVYEGSYRLWEPALADPARAGIDWIYMRGVVGGSGSVGGLADQPDRVWDALADSPALAGYTLVYDADDRRIYHRTDPRSRS